MSRSRKGAKNKEMTNYQFDRLLKKLKVSQNKYFELLREAEEEYFTRFHVYPSDCDDDYWVDTFHSGQSSEFTIEGVIKNAEASSKPI